MTQKAHLPQFNLNRRIQLRDPCFQMQGLRFRIGQVNRELSTVPLLAQFDVVSQVVAQLAEFSPTVVV